MLMFRIRASAWRTAALAAALGATYLSISAAGGSPSASVLHLVERGGGLRVVDNQPKAQHPYQFSAGDIVIVRRDLYSRSGRPAGHLRIACIATTATTQQCSGTATLAHGTLEFAGISQPGPRTPIAVIGGTGQYANAHGTSTSTDRPGNPDIADQTITLAR
jgi:hypothetical protein